MPILNSFLTSKPRKNIEFELGIRSEIFYFFLACPKSSTARSRLNSDSSTSSRSRASAGIPTRTTASTSAGN